MKKNIIKIGLLSLLSIGGLLSMNSCRDAIDIVQDGELNNEAFFTSVDNMQKFLQGDVYNSAENSTATFASSVLTDELRVGNANGGNSLTDYRHFIDSNNGLASNIWLQNYQVINSVARLIKGAERITPSSSEQATYNRILAEARTLRALAYLQLETYFSEDMTNDAALGVMIVKDVPTTTTKLPRSTNAEVFAVIEEDLNFAEQHLAQSNRYLASKDLVNSIRARLNLYRGKYAEAKTYAQKVIDGSGLMLTPATVAPTATNAPQIYQEAAQTLYGQMFADAIQGETIFALARPESGSYTNIARVYFFNNTSALGSPIWEMGRNLFNILDASQGDIRRYVFIDESSVADPNYLTSTDRTSDKLIINKYPGKGSQPLRNDVKMFRLSEMYLILAEAEAEAGNFAKAAEYVGKIREARTFSGSATAPNYTDKQSALADILKERRVELAFEGHRYIDLKRMAKRAGVSMDRNATDDNIGIDVKNLENDSYKYTLPIPSNEVAGNNGIQQNKGY